jgi:hypothetical protein
MDSNPLMDLFSRFMQNRLGQENRFEPIAPLSAKDNKDWEKILSDFEKANSRVMEVEAKRKLFWIKLERKLKIFDRNMTIEGGMVLAEVDKKNNCNFPGERGAIPGFCNMDCDNCAIKPEENDDNQGS